MNRALAAAIVLLMLLSLLRTRAADSSSPPPRAEPSGPEESAHAPPASVAAPVAGTPLRFEIVAEVPFGQQGAPVVLRLRPRAGATRPFDVTAREERPGQRLALDVPLPVNEPELPLRGELVGAGWCIPPGRREFIVPRVDRPHRLVLVVARAVDVLVVDDRNGAPLAGVALVHESAVPLATTALDGRASLVRPKNHAASSGAARDDVVFALAPGFLPAAVPEPTTPASTAALRLHTRATAGTLRGRVVDPGGAPVAGVLVLPEFEAFARELPALAATTGADGAFDLAVPWPGRLVVTARHREFGRARATLADATIAAPGQVTDVELRFPPLFELRAAVTRAGRPLTGASIELVQRDGDVATAVAAAVTGADGRVSLHGPAIAPLWLVARGDGLAPQIRELGDALADPKCGVDAEFALVPGSTATLVVTGMEAVASATRAISWRDAASGLLLGEAQIDFAGHAQLDHLPAGRALELLFSVPGSREIRLRELKLPPSGDDGAAAADLDLGSVALPGR